MKRQTNIERRYARKRRTTPVRIDDDLYNELRALADRSQMTLQEVANIAVMELVNDLRNGRLIRAYDIERFEGVAPATVTVTGEEGRT